jgi:predicted O-methyltransferase YrrM
MAMLWYKERMWEIVKETETVGVPNVAVEIGTHTGHWAFQLLDRIGVGRLYCVDPWTRRSGFERNARAWMMNLKEHALTKVFPLHGTSMEWVRIFPLDIDLLYIDGSHVYQDVVDDLKHWYPKLRVGGLCLMHDANEADVKKATTEFLLPRPERVHEECLGPKGHVLTRWAVKVDA